MVEILLITISAFLMMIGVIGVFLPFLPGVILAWLGLCIYAAGTGFVNVSLAATLIFLVLTIIVLVLDFLAPLLGAKKYKASKYGILGAFLGLVVGIITLGFLGVILGPFLGAFLGELIAKKEEKQALVSAFGTLVGFLLGGLIKLVLALVIIGYFIASFF